MNRRSFLKLPTLLPLVGFGSTFRSEPHHFRYESVIGTSMDLMVCSPSSRVAEGACRTVLDEIDRLRSIFDTRDPASEISRLEEPNDRRETSRELMEVLRAYEYWERRTGGVLSIRPGGADAPRDLDALGKAYIIDRAAAAALKVWPSIDGLLLDIGGDIVTWGRSSEIAVADPGAWYDNARPIVTIDVRNAAVATSGTYARGAHLRDSRGGQSRRTAVAATVIASDTVTANALATTLCLTSAHDGLQLVESTPGAEAIRIASGLVQRTSGFALLERSSAAQTPATTNWPAGYQVAITLPLTAPRSSKRPYVAVWVEDSSGKLVRVLAIWGDKSKYFPDLSMLWDRVHGNVGQFRSVTRATRPAGKYALVWDGLDNDHRPLPLGSYRITVETNQEHGSYAKQAGTINVGDSPTSITLPATTNFDAVLVQYGPQVKP
jgi:thiamine biosynthesis lipoprotein